LSPRAHCLGSLAALSPLPRGPSAQVTRLKQKIDEQYTRINEIKEAIDLKKAAKDGISGQAAGNREKLNKLHAEFKTTLVRPPCPPSRELVVIRIFPQLSSLYARYSARSASDPPPATICVRPDRIPLFGPRAPACRSPAARPSLDAVCWKYAPFLQRSDDEPPRIPREPAGISASPGPGINIGPRHVPRATPPPQEEKKAVQARIQGLRDLQRQIRDESKQLRETVQGSYFKVEDIDKEIARLEARIAHEGLDLTEEKRVMEQIRSLNKSRAAVKEFSVKATSMEAKVSGMEDLDASLKALNAKLDKITAEKEAERKNIGAMLGKANEETSDIPALIAERKAISQVITHLREELSNVRDNWKKVKDV